MPKCDDKIPLKEGSKQKKSLNFGSLLLKDKVISEVCDDNYTGT